MHAGLAVVLAGCLASVAAEVGAFNYFEHRYLGNTAYRLARAELAERDQEGLVAALDRVEKDWRFRIQPDALGNPAARLLKRVPLDFGDLPALAADFARDPRALGKILDEIRDLDGSADPRFLPRAHTIIVATRRQWLNACQWVHRTRLSPHGAARPVAATETDCFDLVPFGLKALPLHPFGSEGYRAAREELAQHERIPDYLALVEENRAHFPKVSWLKFHEYHQKALQFARCFAEQDPSKDCKDLQLTRDALLREALIHEGFAQHFLQDSFAAGHVGTMWGDCWLVRWTNRLCWPPRTTVLHTHDSLNELGLQVKLKRPAGHLSREQAIVDGWTSYGDNHLFIPEADFHRAVVVSMATTSLGEVFAHAAGRVREAGREMQVTGIFPTPADERFLVESSARDDGNTLIDKDCCTGHLVKYEETRSLLGDQRSLDERVPGLSVEGWKLGFAYGYHRRSPEPNSESALPNHDGGFVLKLDYMRDTARWWPDTLGFEFWNIPDRGASYLFTYGWFWPPEVSTWQLAIKGKFGWRTEENFTQQNQTPDRQGALQFTFPSIEGTWEVFRPVAVFLQLNLFTLLARGSKVSGEWIFKEEYTLALGLRFDLAEVK